MTRRYAAKVDANQPEIVNALRDVQRNTLQQRQFERRQEVANKAQKLLAEGLLLKEVAKTLGVCTTRLSSICGEFGVQVRRAHILKCQGCGVQFKSSPSQKRKYCSYACHLATGGAQRAGEAAIMARKKYGAKRDANHSEIFAEISATCPVKDLSDAGCGVPDGIAWVNDSWQWFDVKNPKTAYGRRGLNPVQKRWAGDWRGGPVFLIYNREEARRFAKGDFCGLKRFPSFGQIEFGGKVLNVVSADNNEGGVA